MSDEKEQTMMERMDRQMRVLGKEAMIRMQESEVVIVGLSGLGQEVAKNMILMGCKGVYLCDDEKVDWDDLASAFYSSEGDIGKNRVESAIEELKGLNIDVKVEAIKRSDLTKEFLDKICVVCFTDSPIMSLVDMNKLARETKTRFVACEARGLFGAVFCDMGDDFVVFDENGEPVAENTVVDITNEKEAMVQVLDDSNNHGLGVGDQVIFNHVEGMDELNKLGAVEIDTGEGTGKHSFRIKVDTTEFPPYKQGTGYVKQVKIPKKMSFLPLEESIEKPQVLDYDWGKFDFGKTQCHPLWRASFDFLKENDRYPKPYNEEDAVKLLELVKKYTETPNEDFVKQFSYTCRGKINPMAALIGGFAAQELQKAISGKFTPLNQWFYIDALEALPNKEALPTEEEAQPQKCRYDGNIQVFGKKFQDLLNKQKIFIVGAGALGCEYLKNFALLGVGASQEGELRVTDMDSIEVSNLNRQFLFRDNHVGKMKSTCAAETTLKMNPKLNLKAMTDKVAPETEEVFNDEFWSSLDCAINALDNITARLYVDGKCLYYGKPLIEAGTLGPKANTQTVIPHISESYGAQRDPPEKGFAMCTLKSFPYKIEHCIAWGRGKFEGYFTAGPKNVNSFLEKEDYVDELKKENNSSAVLSTLEKIHELLVKERPKTFQDCVEWGRIRFEKHFGNDIKQLLHTFPLDHKTDEGLPFWFGSKRPPIAIEEADNGDYMKKFVIASASIRAEIYGIEIPEGIDWDKAIQEVKVPEFVPKLGMKIDTGEEGEGNEEVEGEQDDDEDKIKAILGQLPKVSDLGEGFKLKVISFEKDDDTNHHIDFITAASNSRGSNYKIPHLDRFKTKGIVGKIIPAMVTTTALITGFGMIEYIKKVAGKEQIESYRNAYINLALPYVAQSEPMPPKKNKYNDVEFTDWDFIDVDFGKDVKIQEFLDYFKEKHKVVVEMITYGKSMTYMSMIPGNEERLLSEAAFDVSQTQPGKAQTNLDLAVAVETIDGGEIEEFPLVRYKFKGF